jgi:sterol desaturase/sphingolipid hydroxylase (fatty acid hydroxylase superfamily)
MRGSHLDTFTAKDYSFVIFNRLSIPLMFFHLSSFLVSYHPGLLPASTVSEMKSLHVQWGFDNMTLANTVGAFVGFFLLYDLIYTMFHRFLHIRAVYKVRDMHSVT